MHAGVVLLPNGTLITSMITVCLKLKGIVEVRPSSTGTPGPDHDDLIQVYDVE